MLSLHEKNNIYMFFCTEYGLTNLQEDIQSIASSAFIQVLIMHTVTQVSCPVAYHLYVDTPGDV